jgi:hypothetical protein
MRGEKKKRVCVREKKRCVRPGAVSKSRVRVRPHEPRGGASDALQGAPQEDNDPTTPVPAPGEYPHRPALGRAGLPVPRSASGTPALALWATEGSRR